MQEKLTRALILASFIAVILASLPAWWHLTTIVRLPLPTENVRVWQEYGACPIEATWRVVLDVADAAQVHDLAGVCASVHDQLTALSHGSESRPDAFADNACLHWAVDAASNGELIATARANNTSMSSATYHIAVLSQEECKNASFSACADSPSLAKDITALLAPLLARPAEDAYALRDGTVPVRASLQDVRRIEYEKHVRVVFSLLHEDASSGGGSSGWALAELLEQGIKDPLPSQLAPLAPFFRLLHAIKNVHEVQLETQVQWYAPLEFTPQAEEVAPNATEYFVSMDNARVFINSAQWSLESYGVAESAPHMASNGNQFEEQTLHFVFFLPGGKHSPMRLRSPETGAVIAQPAWLVPQWGGVVVWNRPHSHVGHEPAQLDAALLLDELVEPMRLFTQQLQQLLGLTFADVEESDDVLHLAVQGLAWRRTLEVARGAIETLASIVHLVRKIPNLGVDEQVRDQFALALVSLNQLRDLFNGTQYVPDVLHRALQLASKAQTYASHAFFHPSMLAMLYFPDEHKYAVYTPLFGPLLVPLLVALVRECRHRRRTQNAEANSAEGGATGSKGRRARDTVRTDSQRPFAVADDVFRVGVPQKKARGSPQKIEQASPRGGDPLPPPKVRYTAKKEAKKPDKGSDSGEDDTPKPEIDYENEGFL
ncbi:Gpi17p [Malassezia vespertilionis]|uniref:Gpi17p n=1 Tax=Malassezia vespertilionis TaxID=2020962 RepID=A0A2N1JG90_9BASI|nr:Gpi17p [Malassezia vespertilionis]